MELAALCKADVKVGFDPVKGAQINTVELSGRTKAEFLCSAAKATDASNLMATSCSRDKRLCNGRSAPACSAVA